MQARRAMTAFGHRGAELVDESPSDQPESPHSCELDFWTGGRWPLHDETRGQRAIEPAAVVLGQKRTGVVFSAPSRCVYTVACMQSVRCESKASAPSTALG